MKKKKKSQSHTGSKKKQNNNNIAMISSTSEAAPFTDFGVGLMTSSVLVLSDGRQKRENCETLH